MPWDEESEREARYDMTYDEANEGRNRPCRCQCGPLSSSPCRHCDNSCDRCYAPEEPTPESLDRCVVCDEQYCDRFYFDDPIHNDCIKDL